MPTTLGGSSLPKLKVVKPPAYNPWAYVPGGSSPAVAKAIQAQGYGMPSAVIPNANSVVAPQTFAAPPAGVASTGLGQNIGSLGDEITNDRMYQIGESNWKNALSMGENQYLADPFKQAYMTYGFDIPKWNAAHPGAVPGNILSAAQKYLDPAATEAMNKNEFTVQRQLQRSFGQSLAGIGTNQAERGMLGSGGADIAASNANYALGQQEKSAMDQFLGSLGTANSNWLNYQNQQNEIWRAAQEAVTNRLALTPGGDDPGPYQGHTADIPTDDPQYDPSLYPHLNPELPGQVFTPVTVGSSTSFEPKPIGNYAAAVSPATAKIIKKVKTVTPPSPMYKALHMGKLGL